MIGTAALVASFVLAVAAAAAATVRSETASPDDGSGPGGRPPVDTALYGGAVVALWTAVAALVVAIMRLDTSLAYVADQTRAGSGLPLRFSALWSGAEGSLLLFAAIAVTAMAAGHLNGPRWQRAGVGLVAALLTLASWRGADPFLRLDLPPLSGAGMAPILEHYAMVIHPPTLYIGMCSALTPALVRRPATAHRLAVGSMAVLTVALGLGSAWAYVELGWGGWWAWDPIENVALIVWLLLAGGLHWRRLDRERQVGRGILGADVLWALCWPAVFGGAAMTRTSLRTSVHAFADAAGLAQWLWPIVVLSAVGVVVRVRRAVFPASAALQWWRADELRRRLPQLLLATVALIIAAGTYRPFIGGDGTAGFFYSRTLFPFAIVGAVAMAVVPLWPPGRSGREAVTVAGRHGLPAAAALTAVVAVAGWRAWYQLVLAAAIGFAIGPVVASGRGGVARLAGHLGILLILFGALAGTASTESVIRLRIGETVEVDGHRVELLSTDIVSEEPLQAGAVLRVDDGYELTPSVTVFPERALRLPEVSTRTRPWLDTQAILRDVHPTEGALFTVLFRPWNQLVWWGVASLTVAALLVLAGRGGGSTTAAPTSIFSRGHQPWQ